MSDETYNGWSNYPTWCVNLWLSNDEGLYNATNDIISGGRESWYNAADEPGKRDMRGVVGDMLKDWVWDELVPNRGASFAADLLGYALDQVDWREIADSWLEDLAAVES